MTSYSHQQQYDWVGLVWQFLELLLAWAILVIFGIWLICYWLTKEILKLFDHAYDGALKRHDGLVILIPALFYTLVGLILFYIWGEPAMQPATPEEIQAAVGGTLLFSLAWGISIGTACMIALWDDEERKQPAQGYQEVLNLPADPYDRVTTQPGAIHRPLSTDELEAAFADEWQEFEPVVEPDGRGY